LLKILLNDSEVGKIFDLGKVGMRCFTSEFINYEGIFDVEKICSWGRGHLFGINLGKQTIDFFPVFLPAVGHPESQRTVSN